jgi:hypothetical protein
MHERGVAPYLLTRDVGVQEGFSRRVVVARYVGVVASIVACGVNGEWTKGSRKPRELRPVEQPVIPGSSSSYRTALFSGVDTPSTDT